MANQNEGGSNQIIWTIGLLVAFYFLQGFLSPDGISPQEAHEMVENGAFMIDVREPYEFNYGHAPKATNMPLGKLRSYIFELRNYKDKPIVVICRSGMRSSSGVGILQDAGFKQVYNIKGGMGAWGSAGLPTV